MKLDNRHKHIFKEIVGAHSPTAIKAQFRLALQAITGAMQDNNIDAIKVGAKILNQAITRYDLLKKAEEIAEVIAEYEPMEGAVNGGAVING
jgi:hypothetical protein